MLEVNTLAAEREERVLFRNVGFSLDAGEGLHIVGSNGAGKTTLLRILCGLTTPLEGNVCWNGLDIREYRDQYCSNLLYLGHKNANKTELSCHENLRLTMGLVGVSDAEVQDALHEVGIGMLSHLPARFLSQGQQRRLSMARLLLSKARLWVLDEPYVALDYKGIAWLDALLASHLTAGGMLVLTSHQDLSTNAAIRQFKLGGDHD